MITINLTPADRKQCDSIAQARYDWYNSIGQGSDRHRSAKTKLENNRLGVIGEYVVARLLGQDIFDRWLTDAALFGTQDTVKNLIADVGRAVQVKTVSGRTRNLVVPQYDGKYRDGFAYVLMDAEPNQVKFVGWTESENVINRENWITDDAHGPLDSWRYHWRLGREYLKPIQSLPEKYVR